MNIRTMFAGAALVGAVAVTSILGALSVTETAHAAGAGSATIFEPIPTFVPGFENPYLPTPMPSPVIGR